MQFIKKIIKHSFLYDIIQKRRKRRILQQWTTHDQEGLEFYSQFVSPGSLCFDIGANMGNRVKCFLKLNANVIAVEPQDECVKTLKLGYGNSKKLTIIQKAIGASEGEAEMMISSTNVLSSMSPEWIESVKKSQRFSGHSWEKKQVVQMTTLDKLIEQYGVPSFIKIDVEGFEYQVVKGLSQPIKTLSLEFTPEYIESTFRCIDHLSQLGDIRLNYSLGESQKLVLKEWATSKEMVSILSSLRDDHKLFGDVYVQFTN